MTAEIAVIEVVAAAEVVQKLGHRVAGCFPPVIYSFGGILILVTVANLAAELEDAKMRSDMVVGRIGGRSS